MWLVQLGQYVIGFSVASTVARSPNPTIPILISALIIINTALVVGPLSAFGLLTVKNHRISTRIVMSLSAISAIVLPLDLVTRSTLLLAVLALGTVSVRFGNGI